MPAFCIGSIAWARPLAPISVGGLLDLRFWDFERDGPVSLAGEWDFFPGELLSGSAALMRPSLGERNVPDRWDSRFRAGTYRLTVLLPSSSLALGIRYSTVAPAFELEADGLVVARVSNHEYRVGGMWRAFALGDFAASLVVLALFAFLFVRAQEALS